MKKTLLFLAAAIVFLSTPLFGQLSFLNPKYPTDEWTSYNLVSGDFDGNHLLDFAYISEDLKLHMLYQKSDHTFRKVDEVVSQASLSSYTLQSGDLNKDGLTDMVLFDMTAPSSTQKLILYISQGETFSKSLLQTAPALLSKDITIADMNADGHADIVLATDNNVIVVYEGNSTTTFTIKNITTNDPIYKLKAADINNDGKVDLVAANYTKELLLYRAVGDGTFTMTRQSIGDPVVGIAVGDFNNDNFPEIVINGNGSGPIKYFRNDGTGAVSSSDLTGFSQTYGAITVVDYDKDGLKDIVASGGLSAPIVILKNTGNHQFSQVSVPSQVGSISSLIGVDYDQNGSIEIVSLSYGKRLDIYSYNASFTYQDGILLGTTPGCGKVADLNKDGYSDIITGSGVSNSITIFYGDADFSYSKRVSHLFPFEVRNVVANDFNSDGYPDVAFTGSTSSNSNSTTGIYLSESTGILKDQYITIENYSSGILETADVNKDGKADLITATSIFLGNGSGGFTGTSFYPPFSPFVSAMGDLNLDGYPDLVISNGSSSLQFAINDQTGKFITFNSISTTRPNYEIAIETVNNDNYPDIIVGHNNSSKILSVFTQQNGTFTGSEIDLSPAEFPRAVFKDLDNDGRKDIVANGYNDWKIFLQGSNGNFVFNQSIPLFANTYPYQVLAQDINNDLKTDLVGISSNGNPLTIVVNDLVTEPTLKTVSVAISKRTSSSATITVTPGNGKARLIMMHAAGDVNASPVDGTIYNGKLTFGDGTMVGSQNYIVYVGTNHEVTIENLKPNTSYSVASFEYNVNTLNNIINYTSIATTASFVTKSAQTINPRTDITLTTGTEPTPIVVTATSNLPVTLQKVSGNISVTGNTIIILGPGPVQVSASQAGNDEYDPAPTATLSLCINPPIPTIKIEEIANPFEFHLVSSASTNNQWYYNDQVMANETGQVYIPKKNGTFAVKVDYSGCTSMSAKTAFIYTGILESDLQKISLYPNPTSGTIKIETTLPLYNITIIDNIGRQWQPPVTDSSVDLTLVPNGIYYLLIQTQGGLSVKKVLKM